MLNPSSRPANRKSVLTLSFVMAALFGGFLTLDLINYLLKTDIVLTTAFMKLGLSFCASLLVWTTGNQSEYEDKDNRFLSFAFLFTFLGDIFIVVSTHFMNHNQTVFFIGGILFCICHVFLIVRHAKGFKFMKTADGKIDMKEVWFALCFFIPMAVLVVVLSGPCLAVSPLLFTIMVIYAVFLTPSLWIGWVALRKQLFPKRQAMYIAVGITSFFIMELVGAVYNIQLGTVSDICFILSWVFYTPFLFLLPYSGYKFEE